MKEIFKELKAVIVHLSDLHFCDIFTNTEQTPSSLIGAKPHDYTLLINLSSTFQIIPRQIKNRLKLNYEPKINIVVVTGDLTTTANTIAFEEANNYLRWSKFIGPEGPNVGLNMEHDVFIVPGNHDTWFTRVRKFVWFKKIEDRSEAFERYVQRCPFIKEKSWNGGKFLFLGLNSNKTDKKLKNISRGKVDQTELAEVNKILQDRELDKESNIFKIAMLHHHPWLPKGMEDNEYTKMIDADNTLLKLSDMKIDMVLFGHKHIFFEELWEKPSDIKGTHLFLSCAGTATQIGWQPDKYNFKVYLFFKNQIGVINYVYDGFRFIPKQIKPFLYPNKSPFT